MRHKEHVIPAGSLLWGSFFLFFFSIETIEYNHTLPTLINGNVFDDYTYPSEYLPLDWNSDQTTHLIIVIFTV